MSTKIAQDQVKHSKSRLLADVVADTTLSLGDEIIVRDRNNGRFEAVLASGVTPNTHNIVQCSGVVTLALVLLVDSKTDTDCWGVPHGGTVDAVPALQSYFTYCITNKIDVRFAAGKTYYLNSKTVSGGFSAGSIILEDYDGAQDLHIHGNQATLLTNVSAHLLRINATSTNDKFDGLTIENLKFESTDTTVPLSVLSLTSVYLKYCKNVVMRGCTFFRVTNPVKFKICDNVLADGNRTTYTNIGIYAEGDTSTGGTEKGNGITFTNNVVDYTSYALEVKLCDNVIISNNTIGPNAVMGASWNYGIGVIGGQSAQGICENVVVTDNIVQAAGDGGVFLNGIQNGLVSGNIILSSQTSGIVIFGNDLTVESNIIENCAHHGIKYGTFSLVTPSDESYYKILNNKISDCVFNGVFQVGDSLEMGDLEISDNVIVNTSTGTQSAYASISVLRNTAADYPIKTITINGNKIDKASKRGIELDIAAGQGLKQLSIQDNYISRDPADTDAHTDSAISLRDCVANQATIDKNVIFGVSGTAAASWYNGIDSTASTAFDSLRGNNHFMFVTNNEYVLGFTPTVEYLNNVSLSSANTNAIPASSNTQLEIRGRKGDVIGYVPMFTSAW